MQTVLEISGFVDTAVVRRVVDKVGRAHPHLLRGFCRRPRGRLASFEPRDARDARLWLRAVDLRDRVSAERDPAARRLTEHERHEEFALSAPPLIRLLLIRTGDRDRRLVVTTHRLLLDERSHAAFLRELLDAFRAELNHGGADRLRRAALGPDVYFDLESDPSAFADMENPVRMSRELSGAQTRDLLRRAAELAIDAETIVQGAWAFALSRLTGWQDVAFGGALPEAVEGVCDDARIVHAHRDFQQLAARVDPARSSVGLLRAVQADILDQAARRPRPADGKSRAARPPALFDTVATLEPEPIGPVNPRLGVRISTLEAFDCKPNTLSLSVLPGAAGWAVRLDYQAAALQTHEAEAVLTDAVSFLDAVAYAPALPLDRIGGGSAEPWPARVA